MKSNPKKTSKAADCEKLGAYIEQHPKATKKDISKHFGCPLINFGLPIDTADIYCRSKKSQKQQIKDLRELIEKLSKST